MAELPRVTAPLKLGEAVIGTIVINWNGALSGEIKIDALPEALLPLIKSGHIQSIQVGFEVLPATKEE